MKQSTYHDSGTYFMDSGLMFMSLVINYCYVVTVQINIILINKKINWTKGYTVDS